MQQEYMKIIIGYMIFKMLDSGWGLVKAVLFGEVQESGGRQVEVTRERK